MAQVKIEDQFNRAIIIPIVSGILFYLKTLFQIEMPTETLDVTVELIIGAVGLVGLWMDYRKKKVVIKEEPPN